MSVFRFPFPSLVVEPSLLEIVQPKRVGIVYAQQY